ncbi:hypothetical protein Patl1_29338 [Pistacia atlantica]|uniref:Uncharacterized protein n=1 Tax=Pistacia atlantica TaxID=434234 RepID=A0ACC1BFW1_9ROSI|nr:hypothetical protein Patl1_29338 [Pistacia atlantica]
MSATICNSNLILLLHKTNSNTPSCSAKSSKSEETIPSWAKPGSEEPPPWAREEAKDYSSQQGFEIPFYVYLLASTITAIAAIGSIFEYVNQKPVFGILNSDSIFMLHCLDSLRLLASPLLLFFGSNLFKLLTRKLKIKTGEMVICNIKFSL